MYIKSTIILAKYLSLTDCIAQPQEMGKKVLKGIKNTQKQVFNHCTKRLQKKL